MKKTLSALSLLLVAAVVLAPAPAAAQDFTRYVALGDSLTHGYMNGCVVKYGQTDSYSAIIARQAGVTDFQQPLVDDPGLGGCQTMTQLLPSPTFKVWPSTGKLLNATLARPYNNLGVAGFKVDDVVNKKGDTPAGLTDTVLRGQGTALQQAASLKPTFVTVFIGNNDELGAVTSGIVVDGVTLTSRAAFKASYDTILRTLVVAQGGVASGVVMTLPDATSTGFATYLPVYNVVTLGGPVIHKSGPYAGTPWRFTGSRDGLEIPFGSLVNVTAISLLGQGYGVACGMLDDAGYSATGPLRAVCDKLPLPEGKIDATGPKPGVVIYADNVQKIVTRTAEFNADIKSLAATYGYKVFDVNAVFADIAVNGRKYAGVEIKKDFLTGGFFGYDGIHPTTIGYAVFADEFVKWFNRSFVRQLGRPDLYSILTNANSIGGWFPLPQGAVMNWEEVIAITSEIFNEEGLANLAKVFPVDVEGAASAGDDGGPDDGLRGGARSVGVETR